MQIVGFDNYNSYKASLSLSSNVKFHGNPAFIDILDAKRLNTSRERLVSLYEYIIVKNE